MLLCLCACHHVELAWKMRKGDHLSITCSTVRTQAHVRIAQLPEFPGDPTLGSNFSESSFSSVPWGPNRVPWGKRATCEDLDSDSEDTQRISNSVEPSVRECSPGLYISLIVFPHDHIPKASYLCSDLPRLRVKYDLNCSQGTRKYNGSSSVSKQIE